MGYNSYMGIFISIASYRDPELLYTVQNCYDQASDKGGLFFSIISQADYEEHPDLSFIPPNQIRYHKVSWQKSLGACWAREIASRRIDQDFFLQIDSHSRFIKDWDKVITNSYIKNEKYWGDMVYTHHPNGFEKINGKDVYDNKIQQQPNYSTAIWSDEARMLQPVWYFTEPSEYGYESMYVCANSLFCRSEIIKQVPYDKNLYFIGEEPSLTLRLYTRNIRIVNPPMNYMFHMYNPTYKKVDRKLHWEDNASWADMNKKSYERLAKIMTGDMSMGVYGIGSISKYEEFKDKIGVNLDDKYDQMYNW
jgi:hypothetical protein